MMNDEVVIFLRGATMMAELCVAVSFLRYWFHTHDRLYLFFSASFAVMSLNQCLFFLMSNANDYSPHGYYLRLFAFLLIILGIVEKNLPSRK